MNRFLANAGVFAFLAVVILLFVHGWGTSQTVAKAGSAEEEVRRLNAEEVQAFLQKDATAMSRVWSDDLVVTNPLIKFVNKQQVLGMVQSGFLVLTSYDRQIEYLRTYGDTVIVAGSETVVWGGQMPNAGKTGTSSIHCDLDETGRTMARGCTPRKYHSATTLIACTVGGYIAKRCRAADHTSQCTL